VHSAGARGRDGGVAAAWGVMGVILFVVAGSMFGSPGVLLAAIWLVTGLLTGFRFGERALTRTVLRYRPAPASWLEAEVRRLLPGRQKGSVTFHNADHITVGEFRCLSRSTRPGF
jgi:hypothetical protein